jgi:NADPH-dependent curcumin reductase CurA
MKKRLTLRGFIVPEFIPQFMGKFFAEVPALMAQGKLRSDERVIRGWENLAQAFVDMLSSGHEQVGKPVVVVAES